MSKSNAAKVDKPGKPIHHATMNKAIENGVTFNEVPTGFRAIHTETGKKVIAPTAKEALDKVLHLIKPRDEDDEGEEGDEGEGSGKVIVKEKYKKKYQPNGGNCGDKLAKSLTAFRATGEDSFDKVCRENALPPRRWDGNNKGLQWMALSNVLRHRIKRSEDVTVNGEKITSL